VTRRRGVAGVASFVGLIVFAAAAAHADGVVVPSRAVAKPVRTPDQRALVAFDGTTETLVVETTVQGDGREFAWIVPLPAAPKVEASTTGLFPTLEVVTSPRVEDPRKKGPGWAPPVVLAICVVASYLASRRFRGALGVGMSVLLAIPIVCVGTFSCAGEQPQRAAPSGLSRETVGSFDVATVDPGDGSGLRRWLDEHGFAAPPDVDAVATDYAKRGWVFVAAKLRMDAESADVRRVHPLAFTFATKEAVYPMRLTMAANPTCAVELFAFGEGSASADGMSAEFASTGFVGDDVHRELAKRSRGLPVTKLVGTFDATTLREDVVLRWGTRTDVGSVVYTEWGAGDRANGLAAWTALVGGLVVSIALGSWRRGPSTRSPAVRVVAYAVVAAAAGATCYVVWRTTPRAPAGSRRVAWRVHGDVASKVAEHMPYEARAEVAAARAWTADWAATKENDLAGGPLREDDSPGNYVIRDVGGRVQVVEFDGDGRETTMDLAPRR